MPNVHCSSYNAAAFQLIHVLVCSAAAYLNY